MSGLTTPNATKNRFKQILVLVLAFCASAGFLSATAQDSGFVDPSSLEETEAPDLRWCMPGCVLDVNDDGNVKVPAWCQVWTTSAPKTCSLNANGDEDCFELEIDPESPRCVLIDLTLVHLERERYAAQGLPDFMGGAGELICRPGCLVNQNEFGLQPLSDSKRPPWCTMLHDGLSTHTFTNYLRDRYARSEPTNGSSLARCTRFLVTQKRAKELAE